MRLIEYIDEKLSLAKGNWSETMLYLKEEVLSLVGSMNDMRSDNERLAQEVRHLEEVLLKHTLLYPDNYKVQLEKLEAENTRLKTELEMYKAMRSESYVAVNLMHPARSGSKWN